MGALTTRSGFVALAGRPNVGKSTLANAIVGAKVAIVSDKPQTTRRAIRGIASGAGWQLVLVDLPGVQRPRDALTERRLDIRLLREPGGVEAAERVRELVHDPNLRMGARCERTWRPVFCRRHHRPYPRPTPHSSETPRS